MFKIIHKAIVDVINLIGDNLSIATVTIIPLIFTFIPISFIKPFKALVGFLVYANLFKKQLASFLAC